ncbi:MAG: aminodeoxychorismate synthase component I [Bacteroidetes bacterium]|nr:aminodeoxychorismate synthase component I [Fibrella sp.]
MDSQRFSIDTATWRWQALAWAATFEFATAFANNGISYPHDPFPNRLFVGAKRVISFTGDDDFQTLYNAHRQHPSWLVGYFGYDLKNQLETLQSCHPNRLGFSDIFFVEPVYVIDIDLDSVTVWGDEPEKVFEEINLTVLPHQSVPPSLPGRNQANAVQSRTTQTEYEAIVRRIQRHIVQGDVYELNYCIEFFAEQAVFDPVGAYQALNEQSPMPFSVFMKQNERYLLGASPERFLKKTGQTLISQPIKGTVRRGRTPEEDEELKQQLRNSEKEQAENLMIVDLVRNDLARSAETGSVRVEELFGVYAFRQVYQMISTVSATLSPELPFTDALKNAFPMGSMTGAPKIRAMQLIDELESSRRGLFSGAVGFITPDGDFDFNVVIRSIVYDAEQQYASFSVGSAITYDADPEQEYAECMLKARAMRAVLKGTQPAG